MKDRGDDLLAQRARSRRGSNTLVPKVLRAVSQTPLPANVEILEGKGGTIVYRTWLGTRITGNVPKP